MIRIEEFGAIAYGGAVTVTEWWDNKRIAEGKITAKDVLKKASFYTYWGIGLVATLASVFGWLRQWERWEEKLATGFLYDLPRAGYNLSKAITTSAGRGRPESQVVQEAQRILRERQATHQLLVAGPIVGRVSERSYQPEYETVGAF